MVFSGGSQILLASDSLMGVQCPLASFCLNYQILKIMFSDLVTVLIVVSETEPQYAVIPIKQHVNIIFDVFFSTKNLDIWCNKELDQ